MQNILRFNDGFYGWSSKSSFVPYCCLDGLKGEFSLGLLTSLIATVKGGFLTPCNGVVLPAPYNS